MNYLFTPSQVQTGDATTLQDFRLGGMVKAGSIQRSNDSLLVTFTVVDAAGAMPVEYTGILPDLFRDNQSVIATGHMDNARFVATEVLAKHDETYMPKELKDAMAKAHRANSRRIGDMGDIAMTPELGQTRADPRAAAGAGAKHPAAYRRMARQQRA
jgi:cytochrome c-type biogenesis protein CcmE